jgi:hypothetical protein
MNSTNSSLFSPAQGVQYYARENSQYAGDNKHSGQYGAAYGQFTSVGGYINHPDTEDEADHQQNGTC